MTTQHTHHTAAHLPKAKLERNWKRWLFWLVPLGAAGLAAWFIYSEVFSGGPTVKIRFKDAQGLQPGKSEVHYRGAQVGTVKDVVLEKDLDSVTVSVTLDAGAQKLAREGSKFWIVSAQLGLSQLKAPRTIVSGNYITVEPGHGKPQTRFIGLDQAPVLEKNGELRILILAEKLGAIKKRSPIFYRGIQVGEVFDTTLGPSSQTIQILADIQKHFAPLVRMNSKFWNAGGIHVNIGLSGADISAQSAQTLVSGGIDFATPDAKEKQALAGTAFRLYDKPEDAWLSWAPRIDLGTQTNSAPEFSQVSR